MKSINSCFKRFEGYGVIVLLILAVSFFATEASAFQLNVVGPAGESIGDYRWLVEEDATFHVTPGIPQKDTLSVTFHRSYMPVVVKGDTADPGSITPGEVILDPAKHYFVSVLPRTAGSYTIGGAPLAGDQDAVTVYVNKLPFPTAQITIFVFEDNSPINNAPDLPSERGLAGFSIVLEDAGGRYGMSGGAQMLDIFGNPLGTVYERCENHAGCGEFAFGEFILDADGNPVVALDNKGEPIVEPLITDAEGRVTIKNIAPGKYGVVAVPPAGEGWVQTSTIEGSPVIDAWVKANEPPFFAEFGPPGFHVFIGFIKPTYDATVLTGGATLKGQVVNLHLSRPPDYAFYNGAPLAHTTPWVGLNLGPAGGGAGVYAQPANPDGTFSIPNVPPADYQLVVWDEALDIIFAFHQVTVPAAAGEIDFGDVPVFQWFTRLEHYVFNDENENGFWDVGEMPIPEQNINIRWRDGTIYQAFPTDGEGFVPFDELFPFFSWQVAEVDFARFKATGVTVVVDDGGPIDFYDPWSFGGQLNPQLQPDNGNAKFRTETGPVLTEAFQGFLGQTSVLLWGKKGYGPDENGGISGMVFYATTRAEDDPAYAAAEPWEPGIPRVRVDLYDSLGETLLNTTTTDSWDDSLPTDCPGEPFILHPGTVNETITDCYDGLRNFNQVRPGVFDGGYAFMDYYPGGIQTDPDGNPLFDLDGNPVPMVPGELPVPLVAGEYVVGVVPPPGYEVVKEEDKNVDFGDIYVPSPMLLPPPCVGPGHEVPLELTLFPGIPAPNGGQICPLCDRKLVTLVNGQNAACDFFLFTEVPITGHIIGFILDDTANEFDPASPQFGEKYAPPWLPVAIRDWTGREISRTYSDQFGVYNALVPSTYTANCPTPSGMSPNMLTTCMNDPIMPDGSWDEHFNPQYSTFCYTFQYMPGATTYLDTPVIPVAAFAGPDQSPLDCEFIDGTPVIRSVTVPGNGVGGGPYAPAPGLEIMIESMGIAVEVPNPAYDGVGGVEPATIPRDYSFGSSAGTVTVGGVPLESVTWSPDFITGVLAVGTTTGQLVVTRGDNGKTTITGLTVTVGLKQGQTVRAVVEGGSIQAMIDAAGPNDLILVGPGVYSEMVIMWKPVQIQGWGAGSTVINAVKSPPEKLVSWRAKVQALLEANEVSLLPAQEVGFGGIEPVTLFTEEGAGVLVLPRQNGPSRFDRDRNRGARIDGFSILGADTGGGIVVNGYADFLEIGNNRIINNSGFYGGGIRLGHPELTLVQGNSVIYQDADNDNVRIHHNHITRNGGLGGSGGGVSLCTGSDGYEVCDNFVCGNFSLRDGGGIGHLGLSENGLIARNTILFNESFNQGITVSGGGVSIAGGNPLAAGELSPGSGSVKVIGNLIQGNLAGAGDGGGIALNRVNGQDVEGNPRRPEQWYSVDVFNNMIANNMAALAAGGISLKDSANVNIIHNTIANNDSTATAGEAFDPGNPNMSNSQPAGVVSRAHSPELAAASTGVGLYSDPQLIDDIIWHNRSFYFFGDPDAIPPIPYGLLPVVNPDGTGAVYDDLAVLGVVPLQRLNPLDCVLSETIDPAWYDASNLYTDPAFVAEYFNGNRDLTISQPEITTAIEAPPAFDEGGNFIRLRFGPLTQTRVDTGELYGDYHITSLSSGLDAGLDLTGVYLELATDYDAEPRPSGLGVDIGADELQQ